MKFLISLGITILVQSSAFSQSEIDWENVQNLNLNHTPFITTPLFQNATKRTVQSRIINGSPSPSMEYFPHQAGIITQRTTAAGWFWCGGTIISNNFVLTAAHCLLRATEGFLYLGCLNRRILSDDCIKKAINSDNHIIHPSYDEHTFLNDIALVRILPNITFTTIMNKIPLYTDLNVPANQQVVISGWGLNENNAQPDILSYAYVNVIDEATCSKYFTVGPTQICQGVIGQVSVCQGDSGGPMVMYKDGEVFLVGITSYGPTGCLNDIPRVFTRVAAFLTWICENANVCLV